MLLEEVGEGEHARLGRPHQRCVVDVLESEAGAEAAAPLEVVVDAPGNGARDIYAVSDLRLEQRVEVAVEVVDAELVVERVGEGRRVVLVWLGEAELRQDDVGAGGAGIGVLKVVEELAEAAGDGLEPGGADVGGVADVPARG